LTYRSKKWTLEGLKLMANIEGEYDVHEVRNFTVETDMRTGEAVIILVLAEQPSSTSARDFEPHPAFEDENEWLLGEDSGI
jgi:hypothetical protein